MLTIVVLVEQDPVRGTVEVVEVLEAALDAAGLTRAVIGIGDSDLYRQLLTELGVDGEARDSILERLATHDLVGLEEELAQAGIDDRQVATCLSLSQLRGGSEVLEEARELGGEAVERATARIGETFVALEERGAADRVQIDLGLLRDLGYYSGAILEVCSFASTHSADSLTTLAEYVSRMKDGQEHIYFMTGDSRLAVENSPHLEALRARGILDEAMRRVTTDA